MHTFSPSTKAESAKVNENFTDLSTGEGDVDSNRLELFRGEALTDFVLSGFTWSLVSGLNGAMTAGVAYITNPSGLMVRIEVPAITSRTYTASKDTYVDIAYDGTVAYVEVANGATTGMPLTADSIRVAKVVTNGSTITSVVQYGGDPLGNAIRNNDCSPLNIYCQVERVAAQTITNPVTTISWDTIIQNVGGAYSSSNPTRFTAPVDGVYLISAAIGYASGTTSTRRGMDWGLNGAQMNEYPSLIFAGSTATYSVNGTREIYLKAGDYMEVIGFTDAASINTNADRVTCSFRRVR